MAKTLIAFYSHAGENYVNGSVRQIAQTVPGANLTAGVAIHGAEAAHCDREVNQVLAQAK